MKMKQESMNEMGIEGVKKAAKKSNQLESI